jgi:hypothetical protein
VLGKRAHGLTITLRAADPLATVYKELLTKAEITPLVETEFALAEDLSAFYARGSFDIAHSQNALDHCFDPLLGIIEMLKVVRTGGYVALRHNPNEAQTANYAGFHQHNFDKRDGEFVIWNQAGSTNVTRFLGVAGEVRVDMGPAWISIVIKKLPAFDRLFDRSDGAGAAQHYRERIRTMLGAADALLSCPEPQRQRLQAVCQASRPSLLRTIIGNLPGFGGLVAERERRQLRALLLAVVVACAGEALARAGAARRDGAAVLNAARDDRACEA